MKQNSKKRGIIIATEEFYKKWLACHKAAGDPNPEGHYEVTKLYESKDKKSQTNTK